MRPLFVESYEQASPEAISAFEAAILKKYEGIIFDLDGTLNDIGHTRFPLAHVIPRHLKKLIAWISERQPVGISTGGDLKRAKKFAEKILREAKNLSQARVNLTLIIGNGAEIFQIDQSGIYRKVSTQQALIQENIYKNIIPEVRARLSRAFPFYYSLQYQENEASCGVHLHPLCFACINPERIQQISLEMKEQITNILNELRHSELYDVQSSGVAVNIVPKGKNKAQAALSWMDIKGLDPEQMVYVGDQFDEGCNDHSMLSGYQKVKGVWVSQAGSGAVQITAFNVGKTSVCGGIQVVDTDKKVILKGSTGSEHVLRKLQFK